MSLLAASPAPTPDAGTAAIERTAGSGAGVLLRGQVRDSGRPLAGVDVVAVAWPTTQVLQALPEGGVFSDYPLGRAVTDQAGSFVITAPGVLPARFRDAEGRTEVEVIAGDSTREIRWNFTARRLADGGPLPQRLAPAARPAAVTDLRVDLGHGTAWDTGDDPSRWLDASGQPAAR